MKIIDVATGDTRASFYPYGGDSASSVEVALGGVNGDGSLDIVLSAATPGGTEVKAIDAEGTQLADFYALDPAILPGASLAAGDLDGNGRVEIVLGGGPTTNAPASRRERARAASCDLRARRLVRRWLHGLPGLFPGRSACGGRGS